VTGYRRSFFFERLWDVQQRDGFRKGSSYGLPGQDAWNLYWFAFGRYLRIMTCSILLDLDGTLIDSHPGILASCLAALRALGHEPDQTLDIRRTIGSPLDDIMQVLLQSYGDDRVGKAVAAFR